MRKLRFVSWVKKRFGLGEEEWIPTLTKPSEIRSEPDPNIKGKRSFIQNI